MPASSTSHLPQNTPAARQRPKSPNRVLAEAEQQWIFSEAELAASPSIQDGMPPAKEKEVRTKGINFIRQVGIMMKLPELTLSTASIFFNRYLMRMSLVDKPGLKALHHYTLGATALFLATKVEESVRKTKDLIIACCRVAQKKPNLPIDDQSKDFWRWRDTILLNEDVLLETLAFDLTIESPHKQLFHLLKVYGVGENKKLRNAAWGFVTDGNLTQLCLLCTSRTIAVAALYAAARSCEVRFPDSVSGQPWWEEQGVPLKELVRACNYMAMNYEHKVEGGQSIYVGLLYTPPSIEQGVTLAGANGMEDTPTEGEQQTGDNEDEPPWERTRLKRSEQDVQTPVQVPPPDARRPSLESQKSQASLKRGPDTDTNGRYGDESKRPRLDENGGRVGTPPGWTGPPGVDHAAYTAPRNSDVRESVARSVRSGSEEGEVEE